MTSGESIAEKMRRWADDAARANGSPEAIACCEVMGKTGEPTNFERRDLFRLIADEINRENGAIIEAQGGCHASPHHVIKAYAENKGMPMRDGETITQWLGRWFVALPRYEDGTPVGFGDELELHRKGGGMDKGILQAIHVNKGTCWVLSFVGCNHERLYLYDSKTDVLRRAAQKVLDADGVALKGGMTVYVTPEHKKNCGVGPIGNGFVAGLYGYTYGAPMKVSKIESGGVVELETDTYAWCPASWLTTERPDTQERIDEDARKAYDEYWKCSSDCDSCPADWPLDRIGCDCCTEAMYLDLLRRQRELDAAMGGDAS